MTDSVTVHFRTYPDGHIIALFPERWVNWSGTLCEAWMPETGFVGGDDTYIIRHTEPSTDEEIEPLYRELVDMGYRRLNVLPEMDAQLRNDRMRNARQFQQEVQQLIEEGVA